jgi:uncharacterized ParB-like nuclease family protein
MADYMRRLRPEKVDDFAESIAARGQLQPIIVRPRGDTDYLPVVGSHRLEVVDVFPAAINRPLMRGGAALEFVRAGCGAL